MHTYWVSKYSIIFLFTDEIKYGLTQNMINNNKNNNKKKWLHC